MSNFSKSFGLTFINDDHFFSRVAIFQGFSNGLCRIVWGYSYDKIGFKKCFIIIGSAVTLGTTILPLLPLLGHTVPAQAGYASVMVLLYGAFPGIYAIVAAAVADAFGHLHYKANFGLLFTQAVAYSAALLVATQVTAQTGERDREVKIFPQTPVIHQALGYTGIFLVAGACGVVGVINNCFVPDDLSSQKKKEKSLKQPV